jgi:hypothetical protein
MANGYEYWPESLQLPSKSYWSAASFARGDYPAELQMVGADRYAQRERAREVEAQQRAAARRQQGRTRSR